LLDIRKTKKSIFEAVIFSLCIILCVMASFHARSKTLGNKLNDDELIYVYYAGLFKSFFITHNMDNPFWHSDLRYSAVPVGVYLIGLSIHCSPWRSMLREPDTLLRFVKISDGAIKKHPLPYVAGFVYKARSQMLIFMTLCVVLIFALGWRLGWYYCALPAVWLLLANKHFVALSNMVLLESVWLLQHFLNILLINAYLSRWQNKEKKEDWLFLLAFLIGLSAGFLTGTKINGALNIAIFLVCSVSVLVKQIVFKEIQRTMFLKRLLQVSIVLLACFFIFVLFNPALYVNPVEGIKKIIFMRFRYFSSQTVSFSSISLPTMLSRLKFIIKIIHPTLIMTALFFIGLAALGRKIARSFKKNGSLGIEYLLGIAFLVELASLLKYMEVAFLRYVLVLIPYFYLIVCYGATCFVKNILRFLKISRFEALCGR
jgi:hypothetical protein